MKILNSGISGNGGNSINGSDAGSRRRFVFYGLVAISFVAILIYNILTPQMTDDLAYAKIVAGADSFWDLILQEVQQYKSWTGRSVNHIILRCFLSGGKEVFNVFNSAAFVLLTLLIYYHVEHKKKYDLLVYLLCNLFVWIFAVSFAQTVLWETGACNYLWGSVIILGYLAAFRYCAERSERLRRPAAAAGGLFLAGIAAGWCNENTSGGCILLVLLWIAIYMLENRKGAHRRGRLWMWAGLAGNLIGFAMMIAAPGNAIRKLAMEEEHTGFYALASRWLKCSLAIRNHFLALLAIGIVAFILVRLQKKAWKESRNMLLFFLVFLATCYALVLTPEPVARAYFGAGIFLIISCIQGIVDVSDRELAVRSLKLSFVSILALAFAFTYLESGANLARINRESRERFAYIEQQKAAGVRDITVPMLRPAFQTLYSDAYNSDLQESGEYWVNVAYAQYYEVDSIRAVPREDWTGY